jgi:hypothetical protein
VGPFADRSAGRSPSVGSCRADPSAEQAAAGRTALAAHAVVKNAQNLSLNYAYLIKLYDMCDHITRRLTTCDRPGETPLQSGPSRTR